MNPEGIIDTVEDKAVAAAKEAWSFWKALKSTAKLCVLGCALVGIVAVGTYISRPEPAPKIDYVLATRFEQFIAGDNAFKQATIEGMAELANKCAPVKPFKPTPKKAITVKKVKTSAWQW